MALRPATRHAGVVQNGPLPAAPHGAICCGTPLQIVSLTQDGGTRRRVDLVRCGSCGLSGWRLDGEEVAKAEALGALTAVFAPATPRRHRRDHAPGQPIDSPTVSTAPQPVGPPAAVAEPDRSVPLSELLAGWQVLGSSR
jgi:hypothetical protein